MRRFSRFHRGFTLVELMAVVLILGLLLTFVTLRLDSLTASSRLSASARETGSMVGVAFSSAISSGKAKSLNFDLETGETWVGDGLNAPRETAGTLRRLYEGVEFRDVQVGATVVSERGVLSLEISPLGIGTDAMIHLRSEAGAEMTVEVRPLTGTVRFHDGYVAYEEPEVENE